MGNSDELISGSKTAQNAVNNGNAVNNLFKTAHFPPDKIPLYDVISQLTKAQRERIVAGYDMKNFARIFEDEETMATVQSFLKYGMNVSETARRLYMHRNTLIYRLNKIQTVTGLDLRDFNMAVTFEILRIMYGLK